MPPNTRMISADLLAPHPDIHDPLRLWLRVPRRRPVVSVHDASSHSLAWIGSALGTRQLTLGVDRFGESGTIADLHEVAAAIDDEAVVLVDAMPEPYYQGQMVMYDRPGHIPGAVNVSAMALLDETGRFRGVEELSEICGDDHASRHIVYCGGGIAASANAFLMDRLGFEDVALYAASLQEWAADPANPLEVAEH